MPRFIRVLFAMLALVVPAVAQAQSKPVVAVLYFDNNSIGKDRADYDGVGKGIADMLINDMVSGGVQVVERERVQALLTEQNLVKSGAVDPQTAIRLGKILGAQYMVTGGFMSDGKGNVVLTARTINVATSVIANPIRVNAKGDDVLGMIAQLSSRVNTEVAKLPAMQVGQAPASPSAQPAGQPAPAQATEARTADAKPADAPKPAAAAQVAQVKTSRKMDMKTAMLYSKALEEEDAGNKSNAVELYRQVVAKFPDYAPAQQKIQKLSRG